MALLLLDFPYARAAIVAVLVIGVYRLLHVGSREKGLPPGPPTLPIIGNIHQIPKTGLYRQFREWAKQYGPVFSLKFGTTTIIVLHSRKAIHKLLVERGAKYSGRKLTYVVDLITKSDSVSAVDDDKFWREKRKVISHFLSPKQLDEKHYKVQEAEATVLMNQLLDNPDNFYDDIRRYTVSVITSLVLGQRAPVFDTFLAKGFYDVMEKFTGAMEAGANPPVDEFPFLKWIPASLASWKSRAINTGKVVETYWTEVRRRLEARRATGVRRECVGDYIMDKWEKEGQPISDYGLTLLLGEFVSGGADTTSSQLLTLILAFAKHPAVQEKARKEIDAVCGTDRSPVWADFPELPYINAIIKEGMRWRPVAVSAIPHFIKQDDEYEGMKIPKNTMVFIPTWAIHHSEDMFEDHETFNPDRYLAFPKLANDYAGSPDYEGRDHYSYGAGRRICPGIHLAERNMWRIAAKLLWAFEFEEPLDPITGKIAPLDTEDYNNGILVAPHRFSVRIKPRGAAYIEKIRSEKDAALDFLKQYD